MSKVVKARYDAEHNVLRLVEPLEGVADDATVNVTVLTAAHVDRWTSLRGILSKESADELEAIIEEEFPTEK